MAAIINSNKKYPGSSTTVSIVIPLYNQLAFTKICMESIRATTPKEVEIILIDNASSDNTNEYVKTLSGLTVISNSQNLGCAGAWNQGVKSATGEWIVILNNDVILSSGWLEGLLSAAHRSGLDIVSPAIREGEHDYDIESYSRELTCRMRQVIRKGKANGICFMVRRRVFEDIGYFDENFRIGQYEDSDFFLRAAKSGCTLGTVGSAFIHHFGSATQKEIKCQATPPTYALENKAYFARKWNRPWWKRLAIRIRKKTSNKVSGMVEKTRYGHTLMEKMINGQLHYE